MAAGPGVTEGNVLTRVEAALQAAGLLTGPQPVQEQLTGSGVALLIDIDGCLHAQGDSRISATGQPAGESLFRWWPQLRDVLDEHPDVRVVLHSSWVRLWGPLSNLQQFLPADLAIRVAATTGIDEHRRGRAVQAWVDAHAQELGAYVVVDDQGDEFEAHVPLVLCDPQRGLSDPAKVQELRDALVEAKKKTSQR